MAAPILVNVILDLVDGTDTPITSGWAYFYPSVHLISSIAGPVLVTQVPVAVNFAPSGNPQVPLIANDNAGVTSFSWQVIYQGAGLPDPQVLAPLKASPLAFTATSASPCIFTVPGAAYANGTMVQLSGSSLPGGFAAGTTYYVVSSSGSTFALAASAGGAPIASASAGSGVVQVSAVYLSSLVS